MQATAFLYHHKMWWIVHSYLDHQFADDVLHSFYVIRVKREFFFISISLVYNFLAL